ncbi:MAG: DUF4863 family protein [Alphaproteobacteria bacterium]|nr:DUF4863 family protein [Alphaproteobacteria bacterium]
MNETPPDHAAAVASLLSTLAPVLDVVATLDLSERAPAEHALRAALDDATMARVTAALRDTHAQVGLTPRQASPTLRFGRLAKPTEATRGLSIDVVDMQGAGAAHTHPKGEVSWCVPMEGTPSFEGVQAGWAVMPAGSRHVPTVRDGRMLIVYVLPGGEMVWEG